MRFCVYADLYTPVTLVIFSFTALKILCKEPVAWVCRPLGGTLTFSYIRKLGYIGGFQHFEFQYFFFFFFFFLVGGGGSEKKNIVCGIFLGHHKIGLYYGVIFLHFRVFS